LIQSFRHAEFGGGTWRLDPATLKVVEKISRRETPSGFGRIEGTFPGLRVHSKGDDGGSPDPATRYLLRWETLEANRDQPRPEPWPGPSMLRLYHIKKP
jgi:hypothetical protein